MKGYVDDIEKATGANDDFRRVLYTGKHLQLVLMTLQPGEEIGAEVHEDIDQFFRFEDGEGMVEIDGVAHEVEDDDAVIVPATDDPSYPPAEKLFDREYTETTSRPFNPRHMADGWTAAGLMTDRDKPVRFHANGQSASLIETEDIDDAGRMRRYEYLIMPVFFSGSAGRTA